MNLVRALVARSLHEHSSLPFPPPPSGQNLSTFHPTPPRSMFALENRECCRPFLINDARAHSDQIHGAGLHCIQSGWSVCIGCIGCISSSGLFITLRILPSSLHLSVQQLINDALATIRPGLSDITQVMVLLSTSSIHHHSDAHRQFISHTMSNKLFSICFSDSDIHHQYVSHKSIPL